MASGEPKMPPELIGGGSSWKIGTIPVYPLTVDLARKAGRIDAELQSKGIRIAVPDRLIGVSALELGYGVGSANSRHFERIPGLTVTKL